MAGVLSKTRQTQTILSRIVRCAFEQERVPKFFNNQLCQRRSSRSYFSSREGVPNDPRSQANYLRELNRRGDSQAVIRAFESGRVVSSDATLGEYIKALALLDRLDNSQLLQTIQRGAALQGQAYGGQTFASSAFTPQAAPLGIAQAAAGSKAGGEGGSEPLGSLKNPIFITQTEPSFWAQLWKSVRFFAVAFMLISAVGVLFEDRGLARGILNNPDLRPQLESKTKFADVKGVDEAKAELEEVVHYLKDPKKFTSLGGKLPKGVLLVGPPGTGKTMLARAIAGEAGVPFFYCSGSEFEEMFVGVGARRVRDLFSAAKKSAPCIVFIDEIDAIGGSRNPKDQQYMKMTLNQLLVELDGFKPSEGVIVIAATNFPQSLDKALVRPGRFDRHVVVPNPDVRGRQQILEVHSKKIPVAEDVDFSVIARMTPGFSGADLANLVNIAALKAARDGLASVNMECLDHAKDRIIMGAERKSALISDQNRKLTAYHEGGHALLAMLVDGADPVHKATIIPRGMALGYVMQLKEEDQTSRSKRQLLAMLQVLMGGIVAEELIFGERNVTTGASQDLENATDIARAMVTKYGMSESLGKFSVFNDEDVSSDTKAAVDAEVKSMLSQAYNSARSLLQQHEKELHALAAELLEKETLTGDQIRKLVGKAKPPVEAS